MTNRHRSDPPRGHASAGNAAAVLAVVLLALGVVAVIDVALAERDTRDPWSRSLIDGLDGLAPDAATTAVGIVVTLLGLALVLAALRPRPVTHLDVQSRADLWLTPQAVGTLAARAAHSDPEVLQARVSRAGRRRVVVGIAPRDPDAGSDLTQRVQDDVRTQLSSVTGARIELREEDLS